MKYYHFIMIIWGYHTNRLGGNPFKVEIRVRAPLSLQSSHPRQMGKVGIRDMGYPEILSHITCWSCHNRVRIKKELP